MAIEYSSNGNGNGSGHPRLDPEHPLLEAMREASGHILAEEQHKFERERALIEAQFAATAAEVRAQIADLKSKLECGIAEKLAAIRDGEPGTPGATGPKGEPGTPGRDGRLRGVTDWSGGVHYEGDLVVRDGSLYQCARDTGRPPPHVDDWICLARAGRDGGTPNIRGTWSPEENYRALDVCALNGGSFIARKDDPGVCPGEGWQALTLQGKRGVAGPKGERGERGPAGQPAPSIVGWIVDKATYSVTPKMSDGTKGPRLELRPLFEQFNDETNPPPATDP
jgi:hypothetical protein